MKILVIGNGFDIAHGRPTSYASFLKIAKIMYEYIKLSQKGIKTRKDINLFYVKQRDKISRETGRSLEFFHYVETKTDLMSEELQQEFGNIYQNNFWIDHFKKSLHSINDKWVDFENEIENLLFKISACLNLFTHQESIANIGQNGHFLTFCDTVNFFSGRDSLQHHVVHFDTSIINERIKLATYLKDEDNRYRFLSDLINELTVDLNGIIRCLDIYLSYIVSQFHPDPEYQLPQFVGTRNYDKVISFNYTNTYETLYGKSKNIEYDYIHGETANSNGIQFGYNIVLGIEDKPDREINDKYFISFKKYFQRIHKRTGCKYKTWIQDIPDDELNTVYIYGHSLDISDKSILIDLLNLKNSQAIIYYHCEQAYADLISNLVFLLGRERLIEMVYGKYPLIIFRKTSDDVLCEHHQLRSAEFDIVYK